MSKRPGRKYPRGKRWAQIKRERPSRCEVSGAFLLKRTNWDVEHQANIGQVHHLVSERFLRSWAPGMDPHESVNLITLSPAKHSEATAAESRLFRRKGPDLLGFLAESNRVGIPEERLRAALKHYGLLR